MAAAAGRRADLAEEGALRFVVADVKDLDVDDARWTLHVEFVVLTNLERLEGSVEVSQR